MFAAALLCAQLAHVKLHQARVESAAVVQAGAFLPAGADPHKPEADAYKKLPEFCRVTITSTPSSDSRIAVEVWLPLADWNHKFRGQGNGGFAGSIDYRGMAGSLRLGYATAGSDAGHKGEATDASWALGHPEKVIDFGYRAVHEMTGDAKTVIAAFYGEPAQKNYFDSCSDGGREALMEAQRFPADYDGILAGAPANYWTHLLTAGLALQQVVLAGPATYIPLSKIPLIEQTVLNTCDALDGSKDGVVMDQERCRFHPSVLLCKGAESDSCLTAPQVHSLEAIYTGAKDSHGQLIFPPIMPGSEAGDGGWKYWVTGESYGTAEGLKYPEGFFRNMVYEDRSWDFKTANVDRALADADKKLAHVLNATDPDLSAFEKRGGKLILYHGWLDAAISPLNTIDYYNSVVAKMGAPKANQFVRLYMLPGVQHCAGGPGPFIFGQLGISHKRDRAHNAFVTLEDWVEKGTPPGAIVATKLNDDRDPSKGVKMERPLCAYPQNAVYDGSGDASQADSFSCKESSLSR